MASNENSITFTNIMGQGRVNQLGGVFINGRPLPPHIRMKIIEMATHGVKPCHISRQLKVSHGAVSKILNRYAETGSILPGQIGGNPRSRLSIQAVEKHILVMKEESPDVSASDIRTALIQQGICTKDQAPTVSSINRHLRSRGLNRSRNDTPSLPVPTSTDKDEAVNPETTPKNALKPKLSHSIENILGSSNDENKGSPSSSSSAVSIASDDDSAQNATSITNENRRNRTSFSSEQLELLENAFRQNMYPDAQQREQLVKTTKLSEEKVMTWFSNRRARCRKNLHIVSGELLGVPLATPPNIMYPGLACPSPELVTLFSPPQDLSSMISPFASPMFLYNQFSQSALR